MTQSNETTKANLTNLLKDLGLTKTDKSQMDKAYNAFLSDKHYTSVIANSKVLGDKIVKVKAHLKAIKSNLNSGEFKRLVDTYYPNMTSNMVSNFQWLSNNWKEANDFNNALRHPVGNVEVLKRKIRESLKESKAKKSKYEKFGLKEPKTKVVTAKKKTDGSDKMSNGIKTLDLSTLDTATSEYLLQWSVSILEKLKSRSTNKSGSFNGNDVLQFERLSLGFADLHESASHKAKNSNRQASASK